VAEKMRVLLADDAEEIVELLRANLRLDGRFEVVGEAMSGNEAVSMAASLRPDAVLLDLSMPGLDGLEAIPEIRRNSPDTRIVILSAMNAADAFAKAMQLGADRYVEKGAPLAYITNVLADLHPWELPEKNAS
jgi:DNA-binding NarL/FixJ family response regulator